MPRPTVADLRQSLIERKRVLITVKTYPLPSRQYDELVCTAGVLEDGTWVRIYPIPFRYLKDNLQYRKYQWIELNLVRNHRDFRPESYRPANADLSDMEIGSFINSGNRWLERKRYCCAKEQVYTSMNALIAEAKDPNLGTSLATFKPARFLEFTAAPDEREWKQEWDRLRNQQALFDEVEWEMPSAPIRKLPYKFRYRFEDEEGTVSNLMIEDWEIGALFWNCLKSTGGNEKQAIDKVIEKYQGEFMDSSKDLHLFLGTTLRWHKVAPNPFVIVGVFYPPVDYRMELF